MLEMTVTASMFLGCVMSMQMVMRHLHGQTKLNN